MVPAGPIRPSSVSQGQFGARSVSAGPLPASTRTFWIDGAIPGTVYLSPRSGETVPKPIPPTMVPTWERRAGLPMADRGCEG
jgi:hypothetical protein